MYQRYQTSTIVSKPLVPAQMTTMPPRSHTKMEVGIVSCPGWSNTMFGLRFSPSTSQMALPKDFAPSNHVFHSGGSHAGGPPPGVESPPVDDPDGAEAPGVLALLLGGDDGHGPRPSERDQLYGERPEPARAAPHEDHVALLHRVRRPAVGHPVRG